jgi:hypothetical protein
MKITKKIGMILLAAWLILTGAIPLLKLGSDGMTMVMAILAIAAGALILIDR